MERRAGRYEEITYVNNFSDKNAEKVHVIKLMKLQKQSNMDAILIVGAGPAGLACALSLLQHGFEGKIDIIDKLPGISPHSRALAIHSFTLEALEAYGQITPSLIQRGKPLRYFDFYDQKKLIATLDRSSLPSKYPFVLSLCQSETEEIMCQALQSKGVDVLRSVECVDLLPNDHGVKVWIKNALGLEEKKYRFVIGADGAHSIVRKKIDASFKGSTESTLWRILDLQKKEAEDRLSLFFEKKGVAIAIPYNLNRIRYIAHPPENMPLILPSLDPGQLIWDASFHLSYRWASKRYEGSIILIGDAWSIHSPILGLGMNNSILEGLELGKSLAEGGCLALFAKKADRRAMMIVKKTSFLSCLICSQHWLIKKIALFFLRSLCHKKLFKHFYRLFGSI